MNLVPPEEWGHTSLTELWSLRVRSLTIERDLQLPDRDTHRHPTR